MAGEWHVKTLGELAGLHNEQVNPADDAEGEFQHFSIPAFDSAGEPVMERGSSIGSNKFTVPADAVLVSKLNPRLPRVWEPSVSNTARAVSSTEFLVLRPRKSTDRRFLRYLCLSPAVRAEMEARVTGTSGSHQRVRPLDALAIKVSVPKDPSEQRAIAYMLGTLDDRITLNRRMNATLETMARTIFKSWFVDFHPVHAKAEGRDPLLPKSLADQFPNSFEDSDRGKIPTGWTLGHIKDNCEQIQNGGTPRRDESRYWDGGTIPWLGSGEVRQPVITATENFITQDGLDESSAKWVPPYSTVVALYGATAGQVSIVSLPLTTNQAVCALIPKKNYAMFNYLTMREATLQLENKAVGSAQQNISKGIVEETRIVVPPLSLICQFADMADLLLDCWIANLRQSRSLAALRDTLLPKLISGELRVKNSERFVREIAA